jgi:hypothetical protein
MEGDKKNMRFTEIFPRTMVCVMGCAGQPDKC